MKLSARLKTQKKGESLRDTRVCSSQINTDDSSNVDVLLLSAYLVSCRKEAEHSDEDKGEESELGHE